MASQTRTETTLPAALITELNKYTSRSPCASYLGALEASGADDDALWNGAGAFNRAHPDGTYDDARAFAKTTLGRELTEIELAAIAYVAGE